MLSRRRGTAIKAVIALAIIPTIFAFKAEDFKNCADAAFCSRLRGNTSEAFYLEASTVAVSGPVVTATIRSKHADTAAFVLTLTAFDSIVRLHIDEPGANPPRYQVSDVLLPEIDALRQPWEVVKKTATKLKLRLLDSTTELELRFDPVRLMVHMQGKPVMTWNDAGRFIYEHRREKQEGDPEGWWSENFRSHHDSKPRGPESISWDLSLHGFDHVYGIPQRAGPHSLRHTVSSNGSVLTEPYRMYNLDVFEYLADSPFGLYGSIPYLLAHRPGQTVGAFWLNAAEMFVDVSKPESADGISTQWIAESGVVDLFLLLGPSPGSTSAQFASLTGGTALPQLFALGYHQCRWNYKDEEDVANVDGGFDAHNIPYDVLWLDIEHTDGKRYFTWDSSHFPTPVRMQDDVASRGRKMVTIVDPHIKRDDNWPLFAEARDKGFFVKDRTGKDFDGWCWPGSSSYLDYATPEVRSWWADRFSLKNYVGSTTNLYTWNDMNEPSVFNGPEITMHKDAQHANGTAEHRDLHNAYGYYYHMATADGLRRRGYAEVSPEGDRPFVLSRAFFAGTQRVGAIWTGDNGAEWPHLEVSVPMLLSIGVAGLPFSGADVGGFFGNPDAELMTRWYQVGAFYPFFRGHAHLESKRREPWLFDETTTANIRSAIRTRYRMLPYLYTQFLHANVSGTPIMRPLWYELPQVSELDLSGEDAVFMLGSSLLVAPVLRQGASEVRVVLPGADLWYDGLTGATIDASVPENREFNASAPLDTIRTYLRGGQMMTWRERPRRSTAAMVSDPITLVVALDASGNAMGDLYLDDGRSYAFQRGQYAYRGFAFSGVDGTLTGSAGKLPEGSGFAAADAGFESGAMIDKIVVLGLSGGAEGWQVVQDGQVMESHAGPLHLLAELPATALIIRKAGLAADGDWTLTFTRKVGGFGSVSR